MKIMLLSALLACVLSSIFCLLLIPILRRMKAGQNILSYVKEHHKKSGTPTMGGLAFIMAAVLITALFAGSLERPLLLSLTIGLAYMCVGLLDDVLKQKHKENLGLRAWQKFLFQAVIAVMAAIACMRMGQTFVYLPFSKQRVELGFFTVPLVIFVFVATVNAVNLTDGLDGLASFTSIPFFIAFGAVLLLQNHSQTMPLLCFALSGALVGYLLFNISPASIFMGDTGSLSLGGFAACVGCFTGNALYIAVIGIPFVFSVVSVIVQVVYFKATKGKRVFLMAPVHHHFQQKGYAESKIAFAYGLITSLMGLLCIVCIL